MTVSDMFKTFLENLRVDNAEQISSRYCEITASLNKKFRDSESKVSNSLRVGSYGRYTGIKGISDLDMLYIMPKSKWADYKDGNQTRLLSDTRDAIKSRYPATSVRVDRLVVTVTYNNFHVEVQPVFEEYDEDGQSYFKYPDTYDGGHWNITKPRQEMNAIRDVSDAKNGNLRLLCKMIRAWKNKHGIVMGGLLIDTLAYNFMSSTDHFDNKSYLYFDQLSKDFFEYLANQPDRDHYKAPGSNQNVKVKKRFQPKAKTAHDLCLKAIEAEGQNSAHSKWKDIYGRHFPSHKETQQESALQKQSWTDSEQQIEDYHPVDIRYNMTIDCNVYQKQARRSLLGMLANNFKISSNRKLIFKIIDNDIIGPYQVKWKILNRGAEARRRNCIRGEIQASNNGNETRKETADFTGNHLVECYGIQNGVVVARDSIIVPIL